MTPEGMAALRRAATLVHGLPGLRVRLRDGHRTLLEVARPPLPAGPVIGPCAFRAAVARAHEQLKGGARLTLMGLPEHVAPAVDVGVRRGDAALPGGIYRIAVGNAEVHAFATTLAPRGCRDLLDRHGGHVAGLPVRLHHDAATEVTVVHTVGERSTRDPAHLEQLEALLAGFVADEIVHEVAAMR